MGRMTMVEECEHGGTPHSCPVCGPEVEEAPRQFSWKDATDSVESFVPMGGFPAKYESNCPDCDSRIEVGETIFMRDGRAVCEVCA